jgi:hypothetical protein
MVSGPLPAPPHPLNLGGTFWMSRVSARLQFGAQRTIQSFSSSQHLPRVSFNPGFSPTVSGTVCAGPHCQRTSFEGTKKPIGCSRSSIDIPSLGRPRSWRPAKLGARYPWSQPILKIFFNFFAGGAFRWEILKNGVSWACESGGSRSNGRIGVRPLHGCDGSVTRGGTMRAVDGSARIPHLPGRAAPDTVWSGMLQPPCN